METKSIDRLNQLHPKIRAKALAAYAEAVRITPKGVHPFITQTMRTFAESDALYAQGRTKPGQIVTKAAAGQSYHNYGLAIDFVNQIDGVAKWKIDDNWMKVVRVFQKHGFKWGGDFKTMPDAPHFEMTLGYNWRDLLALHKAGKVDKDGYVII